MALKEDIGGWIREGFSNALSAFKPTPEAAELVTKLDLSAKELANERAKSAGLEAQVKERDNTISTLTTAKGMLEQQVTAKDGEIAELKKSAKDVTQKATEIVAGQGVPAAALPASTPGSEATDTLDGVRARISQEKDPVKLRALALKARELRGHGDLFKPRAQPPRRTANTDLWLP